MSERNSTGRAILEAAKDTADYMRESARCFNPFKPWQPISRKKRYGEKASR